MSSGFGCVKHGNGAAVAVEQSGRFCGFGAVVAFRVSFR